MSPLQRNLYEQFNDVVIMDTTSNTNRFQMILCIIIVIDNHYKSRIIASAIIEDETQDTFRWIYEILPEETGIVPKTIFTDSDPSMTSAIRHVYPSTSHYYGIFHIDLNLRKKFQNIKKVKVY